MDSQQQEIVNLTQQNNLSSASQIILPLLNSHPSSFFSPIFVALNGLQRINLFKALISGYTMKGPDDEGGAMMKCFECLRPSEHGVVLEEMKVEDIDIMLKTMEEDKKVAMYELLPYHVVEMLLPIMTASEKKKLGLDDPNSSKQKKCIIQ